MNKNIPYTTDEEADPRRVLDIYAPEGDQPYPALMFVSGGGWTDGSKDWVANVGETLSKHGLGVVTVDHRLMPDVTYADQAQDLAFAFTWIKGNIQSYGGDPTRIIIGGHSAGGHLISLLAVDPRFLAAAGSQPGDITGVILVSGSYDVGNAFGEEAASPIVHVHPGLPPFLLLYGERDFPQSRPQAIEMETALNKSGVPVERVEIPDRDHFSLIHQIGTPGDETTATMLAWIEKTLTAGSGK